MLCVYCLFSLCFDLWEVHMDFKICAFKHLPITVCTINSLQMLGLYNVFFTLQKHLITRAEEQFGFRKKYSTL